MKKPVIICVDDEKVVLISLKEQLKRSFGKNFSVETAESGEDALDLYEELTEDGIEVPVMISDYIMPGMKGDELLIQIHTLAPRMLKILLTGQASTDGITNVVNDANLYRYIAKPWEQEDLVLTVTEAIRSYSQDQQIEEQNEKLRASEKKYRSIFENAVEGIYQTTPEGRILSANPSMARILGYDSVEEMLSSVTNLGQQTYVNPENRETFRSVIGEKGQVIGFEVRWYRKDGTKIWLSLTCRCVRDADGELLYYEGSLVDITERKEREKAERAREAAEAVNEKIMESIRYAKMIQSSLLPNPANINAFLPDSFYIWKPRDIVGGDFIFTHSFGSSFIIAVIDCTGHGVPGAFMTMIASFNLRKIIKGEGCHDPARILKRLSFLVKTTLQQDTDYALSDDGLDAAICLVNGLASGETEKRQLVFAGAKLPLFYICNDEHQTSNIEHQASNIEHQASNIKLDVIKGDRKSIGYKKSDVSFDFTNHTLAIEKGMAFYMASDGFVDQLGGERGRRFGTKRFRNMLMENAQLPFQDQRDRFIQAFDEYKGENERQDDVTVVGFGFK